jgi:hypothetical protein
MPKAKGNELTDADVKFISIVPKGANKIPLKIKKNAEGKQFMDLNSLFDKNIESPFVTKVIINKSAEDIEEVKARVALAGFSLDEAEEKENVIILKQEDAPEGAKTSLMQLDDEVALEVTVNKGFTSYNMQEGSFKDLFAQEGVLPSINTALQVLGDAIGNILFDQDMKDKDEAAKAVKKTVSEFSQMVVELIAGVPVTAFKMDVQKANKKPYGDVEYADPGYQKDKKKRYPVDTEKHIRAAWSYINKGKDADKYTSSQIASIKKKIVAAWKKVIDPKGPPSAVSKSEGDNEKEITMTKKADEKEKVEKTAEELAAEKTAAEQAAAGDEGKETVEKAAKKKKAPPKGDDEDNEEADDKDEEDENGTDDTAADNSKGKGKAKKADEGKEDVKKEDAPKEPTLADVLKALNGVAEQVTTLKTETAASIAKVTSDLKEVATVAKSAADSIEGLALTDGDTDRVSTKKAATNQYDTRPLVDTGWQKPL